MGIFKNTAVVIGLLFMCQIGAMQSLPEDEGNPMADVPGLQFNGDDAARIEQLQRDLAKAHTDRFTIASELCDLKARFYVFKEFLVSCTALALSSALYMNLFLKIADRAALGDSRKKASYTVLFGTLTGFYMCFLKMISSGKCAENLEKSVNKIGHLTRIIHSCAKKNPQLIARSLGLLLGAVAAVPVLIGKYRLK